MTSIACLRVALENDRTGLAPSVLGPLVAKFSSAYLETRWLWPRRFEALDHYTFLLTDPRADELDPEELTRLADELQIKLFGERDSGDVSLLLFEGTPDAVTAFAGLGGEAMMEAVADPDRLPLGGRLTHIVPRSAARQPAEEEAGGELGGGPQWRRIGGLIDEAIERPMPEMPQLNGVQGIYFTSRQLFVGDVMSSTPGTARSHLSLVEGLAHMPPDPLKFDSDCMDAGIELLEEGGHGTMLYFPVCYTNIVHATQRAAYEQMFQRLPQSRRNQLAAAVYDVPRDPAFGALSQLRATLEKYFTSIDLRTNDPAFQIEKLPERAVTSVTLTLPDGARAQRLAVLKRFAERMAFYKERKIWPAVTNVRTREELEACAAQHVPFVTGPAVCRLQTEPVGGRMQPMEALPVLAA